MESRFYGIEINSLFLDKKIAVKDKLTDFKDLPLSDDETPFVTSRARTKNEQGVSRYIGNMGPDNMTGAVLERGVHLHFILPDVFLNNRGDGKEGFLPAPNRWIITRKRDGQQWMVESDFLSKEQSGTGEILSIQPNTILPTQTKGNDVGYIFKGKDGQTFDQPFMYMGRKLNVSDGDFIDNDSTGPQYWPYFYEKPLTSAAFGIKDFAVYYPNCKSVFGFFDKEGQATDEYTVYAYFKVDYTDLKVLDKELNADNENADGIRELPIGKKAGDTVNGVELQQDGPAPTELEDNISGGYTIAFKGETSIADGEKGDIEKENVTINMGMGKSLEQAFFALVGDRMDEVNAEKIADLLEFAQMGLIDTDLEDPYAVYFDKRQQDYFDYDEAGIKWELALEKGDGTPNPTPTRQDKESTTDDIYYQLLKRSKYKSSLSTISDLLTQINELQFSYDNTIRLIDSFRYRIYATWYKVLYLADRPDKFSDVFENYLYNGLCSKIKEFEAKAGLLNLDQGDVDTATFLDNMTQKPSKGLAKDVKAKAVQLFKQVDALNAAVKSDIQLSKQGLKINFSIKLNPNGRWYVPEEPSLAVQLDGTSTFNPIYIQWEAKMQSSRRFKNSTTGVLKDTKYHSDLVGNVFHMHRDQSDLVPDKGLSLDSPHSYQGLTMLSKHVGSVAKQQLKEVWDGLGDDAKVEDENGNSIYKYLDKAIKEIENHKYYGQRMNGFNEALIMKERDFELPVFSGYMIQGGNGSYVDEVREIIQKANDGRPNQNYQFEPFRSGLMTVTHLYLIDSFGRFTKDIIARNRLIYAKDMKADLTGTDMANHAFLHPRILQPLRLDTYFLGQDDKPIRDNIPVRNPICGWIIANNLDHTLLIYKQDGTLEGILGKDTNKILFKGPFMDVKNVDDIENKVMRTFVNGFTSKGTDAFSYFDTMHKVINQSLEYINPENISHHLQYALLANRPIALIRKSMDLKTVDALKANQSQDALDDEISLFENGNDKGLTQEYEKILFPIQVGRNDYHEDGVIGYWKHIMPQDDFYAVCAKLSEDHHESVKMMGTENEIPLDWFPSQSLESAASFLTMLVDPIAGIHTVTRLSPNKRDDIPPIYYKDAIANLQVTFNISPVITPKDKLHVPLMKDADFYWEWWNKPTHDTQFNVGQQLVITEEDYMAGVTEVVNDTGATEDFAKKLKATWSILLQLGTTAKNNQCLVPMRDGKYELKLENLVFKDTDFMDYDPYRDVIALILENYAKGILPPVNHIYSGKQVIKDGWLQLNGANK